MADPAMNMELVSATCPDGVVLTGTLRRPGAGARPSAGADVVVMHHGVGGNFYNPHFFEPMGARLLERGCAVLRVNNRGHDLAYNSPAGRLGAAFEAVDDCRLDWKAWIDAAEALGFRRVGLWGHSLGAVKTIYFLARAGDPRVTWAIAASPPRFCHSDYVSRADGHLFKAHFDQATRLVEAGEPDAVFPITIPTTALMAARTYIDKYGPEERFDIIKLLPGISLPLLLTIGAKEGATAQNQDRFPFFGLAGRITDLAATQKSLSFDHVAEADHWYTGKTGELWAAVDRWLGRNQRQGGAS